MAGYFDQDGVLMTINTKAINEAQLRRDIRYQKERSLHPVSYKRIGHHAIDRIFLSRVSRQEQIAALAVEQEKHDISREVPKQSKPSTIDKIAGRQLNKKRGQGVPLKDRITYFDPADNLQAEIKKLMEERGLSEMTIDDLVQENLERQALREILAEMLEDKELKHCMSAA
jgi:hypothetical protein